MIERTPEDIEQTRKFIGRMQAYELQGLAYSLPADLAAGSFSSVPQAELQQRQFMGPERCQDCGMVPPRHHDQCGFQFPPAEILPPYYSNGQRQCSVCGESLHNHDCQQGGEQ